MQKHFDSKNHEKNEFKNSNVGGKQLEFMSWLQFSKNAAFRPRHLGPYLLPFQKCWPLIQLLLISKNMKLNTFFHFSMNKFSFVELYAKCVKEGHIEWTRPEKAIETTKNAWQKAKLRLVMLSAGAIIEITCSKVSQRARKFKKKSRQKNSWIFF